MKIPKRIVLFCKKALYKKISVHTLPSLREAQHLLVHDRTRFRTAYAEHTKTLTTIEALLKKNAIPYDKCYRGNRIRYDRYDLIITVGGDGTFLEATRGLTTQEIIGINSAPSYSMGRLCTEHLGTLGQVIAYLRGQHNGRIEPRQRLRIHVHNKINDTIDSLNELLICHRNPAEMSRYLLRIGGHVEEQRSSGVWVATATGSSGAICSAGGSAMAISAKQFQYMPRELYTYQHTGYRLTGGTIASKTTVHVTSLMRGGIFYADGVHVHRPFNYGAHIEIARSPYPVNVVCFCNNK